MAKGNIRVFAVLSIIFFICLVGWFFFRVTMTRSENIRAAEQSYKIIQGELSILHKLGLDLDSEALRDRFSELNRRHPPLRAMAIYSETSGLYYVKSDESSLFVHADPDSLLAQGTPEYSVGPMSFLLLRHPLPYRTEGAKDLKVDALYEILGKTDIYPPLLLCLLLLAVFLLITGIFLAVSQNRGSDTTSSREPEPASKPKSNTSDETDHSKKTSPSGLYSPTTGLVWQTFLNERLDSELKRSASFDQDLVLGIITIAGLPADISPDKIGALVLERFPFSDLAFEYGEQGCAVIIPNTDLDQGISEFETFLVEVEKLSLGTASVTTSIGLSSRNGRLLDSKRLIKEAHKALQKAASEKKSTIIAFRTDPSKYREFIAAKV